MDIGGEYVVSAVLRQLKTSVPSVSKLYREDQEQNIVRPCFFVKEMPLGQEKLMNNRYERNYRIRITYLPSKTGKDEVECRDIGETLLGAFRILSLEENHSVFGQNLEFEVTSGELHFTAEFPMHVVWSEAEQTKMKNLDSAVEFKEYERS